MTDRKLASIQKIVDIQPIPNADKIEVAKVLGYNVVVKKGDFKVEDYCVYCEVDSVLPDKPEFAFLKDKKFRVRTIRLRKQLSQGICFPLNILDNIEGKHGDELIIGEDVTERLGIKKYEVPIPIEIAGQVKRMRPGYIPKTDEYRIQSYPELLDEFKGKYCYTTIKVNGTSGSFANLDGEIDVCSRRLSVKDSNNNVFWELFRRYNIGQVLKSTGNYCIQGEVAGPGIQKNKLELKAVDLFVFNIYDINAGDYLSYSDFMILCNSYHLQTVPVIAKGFKFNYTMDELIELAKGKYPGTNNHREGIVIRPLIEAQSNVTPNGRLSMKILNNDKLLEE